MIRQSIVRSVRATNSSRLFSVSARTMAGGDTGAPKAGGQQAEDAFGRRRAASEEMFIRNEERQKLLALKQKLAAQRKHLDELDKHIDDLTKEAGGEQN